MRPSLTYGSTVWAPLEGLLQPAGRSWIGEPLEQAQQRCLQTVTGVYKATSRKVLEQEAAVPPLRAHIARLQLQARARLEASGTHQETATACDQIRRHLAPRRGHHRTAGTTPGKTRHQWAKDILWRQQQWMEDTTTGLGLPPWSDNPHQGPAQPSRHHPTPTPPQTLWVAYQLAEQWCWDCW